MIIPTNLKMIVISFKLLRLTSLKYKYLKKALSGFKYEVKTLNGLREITFPPGSRNRDSIKLSFEVKKK